METPLSLDFSGTNFEKIDHFIAATIELRTIERMIQRRRGHDLDEALGKIVLEAEARPRTTISGNGGAIRAGLRYSGAIVAKGSTRSRR